MNSAVSVTSLPGSRSPSRRRRRAESGDLLGAEPREAMVSARDSVARSDDDHHDSSLTYRFVQSTGTPRAERSARIAAGLAVQKYASGVVVDSIARPYL